ncbi:hypothetical protein [Aquamicrobium sp. LC103]|uniref:hypothetical protein n=1 Tax=Aquamicrobium sp. LC103 TaxID=1120658 RepID=UPI00063ECE18|nr:hypothetical protein [Aquamicrobium sp. LC103]TKT75366.1 hypothetical protein XW59_019775 [Aquamicrobium sp. LC103]
MKVGLTSSLVLHVAALGFGLVSLSSPRSMEAANVESFPVDIVPVEEFSQSVAGDRQAPVAEKPAPQPTSKPETVEDARNIGDNTVDLDNAPTPNPRPRPVETAAAPPPAPEPEPTPPVEQPKNEPQPPSEPAPVPATEVTPEPEPKQEVKPDPAPETTVASKPEGEAMQLPDSAPSPQARPQPPQAQTAKAPERKNSEQPAKPRQTAQSSTEDKQLEDEISALLNRDKPSGGGARRSTEQAALGGRQTTGAKLAQSEIDALRSQVQRCWNPPVGAAEADSLVVSIRLKLKPNGELDGTPEIVSGGGSSMAERAAADAARRAVMRCAPFNAPADKYEAWADVQFNFDPRDMF